MRRLTDRLHPWWAERTLREQRMLALMAALVAATLAWLAVVRPVLAWREAAAADRVRAEAVLAGVRADLRRVGPTDVRRPVIEVEGFEPLALRTAEAAGLDATTGRDAAGRLEFRIAHASTAALFGWLSVLENDHAIAVVSLGVVENPDATLQVEGVLSRLPAPSGRP